MENIPNYPAAHNIRTQVVDDFIGNMINRLSNISDYYEFFNTAIDLISKIPGSKLHIYPKPISENDDGDTPQDKEILLFHKKLSDYKERQAKKGISTHQVRFTHTDIESQNGLYITMESGYKIGFLEIPGYSDWTERFAQNRHRLAASIQKQVAHTIGSRIALCNMKFCLKIAREDSLTGLYSRGYGRDLVFGAIEAQINKKESLGCMIFIDLDNFKRINDQCGHNYGDHVLQSVAHIIKQSVSPEDIAIRYGGEEVIIYCPGRTDKETKELADTLNKNIATHKYELPPQLIDDKLVRRHVTASIGISSLSDISSIFKGIKLMDEGILRADIAMYYRKNHGKNGAHIFEESIRPLGESKNTRTE